MVQLKHKIDLLIGLESFGTYFVYSILGFFALIALVFY